ncbi:MAG: oxidoreductase-like domain-containing protein [Thermomonas sp.]|uniref:oxidoreductase-like domain-containing protein n=1 Tax=Thermomonas sp. TaxID=1971895 RepID=UPI0039E5F209
MSTQLADIDPRPIPPEAPLPSDCCESGCDPCVFDSYSEELEAYRQALAAWRLRHPDADEQAGRN